jgi:2'-5' RNA ligase
VAWVATENLHITLKFLGGVEESQIEPITTSLAVVASDVPAFDAALRGLGAFPSLHRPRVIWVGLAEGVTPMTGLASAVDQALAAIGVPREERPFSGHVTLGRVREPRHDPALAEALTRGAACVFGEVRVEHVSLMRSDLSPRGARYTELAALPLRGRRAG